MGHHISSCNIEAKYQTQVGRVELVNYSWQEPIDIKGSCDFHILQFCLLPLPENSKACFAEHWGSHRFENFGQISLLPAGQTVHCRSSIQQHKSVYCSFKHSQLETWLEQTINWEHYPFEKLLNIGNARMRHLLQCISEELENPGFHSETLIELTTGQLVIELCRHLNSLTEQKVTGGLSARNLRLIDQRLSEETIPPTVEELAELCHLSSRHMSRAFSASKGRSLGDYITEWRIHHAKKLLASGKSVKAVAYSVGFSAPSNFTTAFVRETGKKPSEFRRQVRVKLPSP